MKTLILLEMTILIGGDVIIMLSSGEKIENIALHDLPRRLLAVVLLLVILLTMVEVGAGKPAVWFGGLVSLSYLLAAGGKLGPAAEAVISEYLSTRRLYGAIPASPGQSELRG